MADKKNLKEIRLSDIANFNISYREAEGEEVAKMIIEGYAAVYNSETIIGFDDWAFKEVIERGAFDGANLKDVPLKYNHSDEVPILARTRNKSLKLTVDDKGLKIYAELLDTTDGIDMYKRIKAGLIDKMSFAFTVSDEEIDTSGKMPIRRIKKFDKIFDVSVVDTPAYEDTSVFARSRELAEAWRGTLDNEKRASAKNTIDLNTKILLLQYAERN